MIEGKKALLDLIDPEALNNLPFNYRFVYSVDISNRSTGMQKFVYSELYRSDRFCPQVFYKPISRVFNKLPEQME